MTDDSSAADVVVAELAAGDVMAGDPVAVEPPAAGLAPTAFVRADLAGTAP